MSCSAHDGTAPLGCPPGQTPAAHSTSVAAIANLLACLIFIFAPPLSAADCLSLHEAARHIGETKCVSGKVLNVKVGNKGVHFLDFLRSGEKDLYGYIQRKGKKRKSENSK